MNEIRFGDFQIVPLVDHAERFVAGIEADLKSLEDLLKAFPEGPFDSLRIPLIQARHRLDELIGRFEQ